MEDTTDAQDQWPDTCVVTSEQSGYKMLPPGEGPSLRKVTQAQPLHPFPFGVQQGQRTKRDQSDIWGPERNSISLTQRDICIHG